MEKRGSFNFWGGDELVCGGVFEISRIVELFFGVRVGGAFCEHNARSVEALVVLSSGSGGRDRAVDRIFAGTSETGVDEDSGRKDGACELGLGGKLCDSFCGGELQRIEALNVYSSHLSVLGVDVGDLVGGSSLFPV